jgi:hypothetical protein
MRGFTFKKTPAKSEPQSIAAGLHPAAIVQVATIGLQRPFNKDAENSYLAGDELEAGAMGQLLSSSITYRIAVGPQQGRKVFTLQTLPARDQAFDDGVGTVGRRGPRIRRSPRQRNAAPQ